MTVKTPLAVAVRKADDAYGRFEAHRDRHIQRRKVLQLHAAGYGNAEIATAIGVSTDIVRRITNGHIDTTLRPATPTQPDFSDERCIHLERTAQHALKLAVRLRDDDPRIVWDALTQLERTQLQELAVILLAAVPVDRTRKQIFGWVQQIGTTRPQRPHTVGRGLATLTTRGKP